MSLEDKVKDRESKGFIRKAAKLTWKLGMAAATTALGMTMVGTNAPIIAGAFAGGGLIGNLVRKKSLYGSVDKALTTYSAVNTVLQPMIWLGDATFPLIDNSTLLGKAARSLYAATVYNAAFVGSYRGASHLIDNYMNPKGITNTVSDKFYNEWKRIGLGFLPGYALAANGISTIAGLPTFAWNALPLGMYNSMYPVPVGKKQSPGQSYMPSYAPAHS